LAEILWNDAENSSNGSHAACTRTDVQHVITLSRSIPTAGTRT